MKKYLFYDLTIIIIFTIWAIIDIFSIFNDYSLLINFGYSFLLLILFQLSIKKTKYIKSRYHSIIRSIYVLMALIIAPVIITYFNETLIELDAPVIINIGVSTQSLFYLFYSRKEKLEEVLKE